MAFDMKIVAAIDFGLTYTGAAFGCPWLSGRAGEVSVFHRWPSHDGTRTAEKTPTVIAYPEYNDDIRKRRWGYQVRPGLTTSSWMKFFLDDEAAKEVQSLCRGPWARAGGALWLPDDKEAMEIIAEFLAEIYRCVMKALEHHVGKVTRGNYVGIPVEFWFTVPSSWSEQAKSRTRHAAAMAGFNQGLGGYPAEICLVSEPQAAMTDIISQSSPTTFTLWPGDCVIICDSGGGTTDVASYQIHESDPYSYSEICASSSSMCGATTVQRALYTLMINRFGSAFLSLPLSMRAPGSSFMVAFESYMARFNGSPGSVARLLLPMGSQHFRPSWYNCHKQEVLLSRDDLVSLFSPTLESICSLLSRQMAAANNHPQRLRINKIFLVGGFSLCPYVYQTITNMFFADNQTIVHRPNYPQESTVRGAVIWGSGALRPATRVSECHYGVESSMTANIFQAANFHVLSSLSGGQAVTQDIAWLVPKGIRYEEGSSQDYPMFLVHKFGDFPTKTINVYTSAQDAAPGQTNARGVSLSIPVMCTLVDLDMDTTSRREVNGCMFYLVECVVRVTLGQNDGFLHFDVSAQGQIINVDDIRLNLG